MHFQSIDPPNDLRDFVKNYWFVKSDDPLPVTQKIIPDGFPEIILHFGDPYKIKLKDVWEHQTLSLTSGQIKTFFFLQNTGPAHMVGIKLMPTALTRLFSLNMTSFTDKVVPLMDLSLFDVESLRRQLVCDAQPTEVLNLFFKNLASAIQKPAPVIDRVIDLILHEKGKVDISFLADYASLSTRQLERLFNQYIGLSPKYYSRIIRFNYIFELMQQHDIKWCAVAVDSGYYDQAHFIKEFKAFSGEHPSKYGFDEDTFANFFLKSRQ